MIEVLPSPANVVAVKLTGTMTAEDFDVIIDEVENKLARYQKLGILLDLAGFSDFTHEAARKDVRYDMSKLLQLNRFPREALITERQWMISLAKLVSPLLPFIAIRTFHPDEREEAMAWVSEVPLEPLSENPSPA